MAHRAKITIELDADLNRALERLVASTKLPKAYLARRMIRAGITTCGKQIARSWTLKEEVPA